MIVIVSDGEDTISDATFEDAVKAVQAYSCQVYVVKTKDFENYKRTGQRSGNANIRSHFQRNVECREITAQTGGAVYSPIDEKELDQAFNQISAELAQQYILSYYPENQRQNRTISQHCGQRQRPQKLKSSHAQRLLRSQIERTASGFACCPFGAKPKRTHASNSM